MNTQTEQKSASIYLSLLDLDRMNVNTNIISEFGTIEDHWLPLPLLAPRRGSSLRKEFDVDAAVAPIPEPVHSEFQVVFEIIARSPLGNGFPLNPDLLDHCLLVVVPDLNLFEVFLVLDFQNCLLQNQIFGRGNYGLCFSQADLQVIVEVLQAHPDVFHVVYRKSESNSVRHQSILL